MSTPPPAQASDPGTDADGPTVRPGDSLAALRIRFREANGITDTRRLVEWFRLGPIPFPIPNPPARQRALRTHDLHHLVTGYPTDLAGEFQISAWECGAGLHTEPLAWVFCTAGTSGGMLRYPTRTVRAYARGRRCRSLFGQDLADVDGSTLDDARAWCRTASTTVDARPALRNWIGAAGWASLGLVVLVMPPLAWILARMATAPPPFPPVPNGTGTENDETPGR